MLCRKKIIYDDIVPTEKLRLALYHTGGNSHNSDVNLSHGALFTVKSSQWTNAAQGELVTWRVHFFT